MTRISTAHNTLQVPRTPEQAIWQLQANHCVSEEHFVRWCPEHLQGELQDRRWVRNLQHLSKTLVLPTRKARVELGMERLADPGSDRAWHAMYRANCLWDLEHRYGIPVWSSTPGVPSGYYQRDLWGRPVLDLLLPGDVEPRLYVVVGTPGGMDPKTARGFYRRHIHDAVELDYHLLFCYPTRHCHSSIFGEKQNNTDYLFAQRVHQHVVPLLNPFRHLEGRG